MVANKNNADLEVANLSIQYPQGSHDPEDPTRPLSYVREELGSISAGREITRTARAILFGEQGEIQEIKVSIEYKVKGSNATFRKDKVFEVVIGETPVSMTISQPRFINSGDTFTTTITLTLNSSEPLGNVMVRSEYPYGYIVTKSSPAALHDDNIWLLGDMAPGDKKTLTIEGRLLGENNEERTFRFYAGVADPRSNDPEFGANLVSSFETIAISRPSVGLSMELNGDRGATYVAPAGQSVTARVSYQNNLSDKIVSPKLQVKLSGSALDRQSVTVQGDGFYNSQSNTITWNLESSNGSDELLPGENGAVSFSFSSLAGGSSNSEIGVQAVLVGTSLNAGESQITTSLDRSVRISSQVTLSSRALFSTGPFANRGVLPPKAETETTYTVTLTAGNTQNDIKNAKVTATLGPNVEWLSAKGNDISYNPSNNTITWNLGDLPSGTGFSSSAKEVSFQVALVPSLSQVGTAPTLVSGISLTGLDSFTSQTVTVTNSPISTRLTSDPQFVQGDDMVVR